ncbi:MAG TPA: alpha/beta hydrolase [Candidatus Bathyarchaeia archaeon]|nr:alpha/beta hydrolase [Candidatus Bathyarchaeia archaeon]
MKRSRKIALITIPVVLVIGLLAGSLIFLSQSYKPMNEAILAMESDSEVTVESSKDWITFIPTNFTSEIGFIFYPGGNVEPESYAIIARGIAEGGFFVGIIKMPFDLAVFAPNKASELIAYYGNISTWIIGGHSLGGSMAAQFVYNNPDTIAGLVLLAAYPANANNISSYTLPVLSMYGSLDGVLSTPINETKSLLPANTVYIEIIGGNHAYFGSYGEQKGDNQANISRSEQQQITINEILALILSL